MSLRFIIASVSLLCEKILLLAIFMIIAIPATSQIAAPALADSASKTVSYEVISIHPNNSANQSSGMRSTPDGIVYTNAPLGWLLRNALNIITDDQLAGLPGWVDSDRYDIQAKMDDAMAAAYKNLSKKDRVQKQAILLQSLLADRCQLKFHRETKQLPVYNLVIAKGGLKIKESPIGQSGRTTTGPGQFSGQSVSIEGLVYSLSNEVGRIVIDKTALGDKRFDIALKWTPDEQQGTVDAGPSIFTALEEQLGLKLVATKGPVEVVVIDHMEKPEAN